MARLRGPDGCPWDREQSIESLGRYLVEETYETLDAIERGAWDELAGELGDLQLQIVFQAQIAREQGLFTMDDVLDRIADKLVRRHPHVFGSERIDTAAGVVKRWDEIKAEEKRNTEASGAAEKNASILDQVPRAQPALLEAYETGRKAAKVGFDWERFDDLLAKLREESGELSRAVEREERDRREIEEEVGDLLFMAVNIARFLNSHPELALRRATAKFRRRFRYIEGELAAAGRTFEESSIEEMERLWQKAKKV